MTSIREVCPKCGSLEVKIKEATADEMSIRGHCNTCNSEWAIESGEAKKDVENLKKDLLGENN